MKRQDVIATGIIGIGSGVLALPVIVNILPETTFQLTFISALLIVGAVTILAYIGVGLFEALGKVRPVFPQVGKFAAVGVLNTLIDFGVLNVLSRAFGVYSGGIIALFNATGFLVATVNSYAWNKYWTFDTAKERSRAEFYAFFAVSVIGIVINSSIVWGATSFFEPALGLNAPQWENIAKLGATFISLIWNFLGYKFIVFIPRKTS